MKTLKRLLSLPLGLMLLSALPLTAAENASLVLKADQPGPVINRHIYGQFTEHLGHCIYGGIWVGKDSPIPNTRGIRNDVVAALRKIHVPDVRWPGGCFASTYHWRDGIGPQSRRPTMINSNWGGVVEDNAFGTHEFMDFCQQIGAEPYLCGNVGSGTVQEMADWIEYMTSDTNSTLANLRRKDGRDQPWKVPMLAIGNENWGCGGNMTPEFYADQFLRYNTFIKDYSGNHIYRVACGPGGSDYNWTKVLMKVVGDRMNGLALHYYTLPTGNWKDKGSATRFDEQGWFNTIKHTLFMNTLIEKNSEIMDKYDPQKKVGLIVDEWGDWFNVEPGTNPHFLFQQNTLRDAIVAGLNLHIFQAHADRVRGANIAQMINVLQSMILTDGPKMIVTPTYWVFDMFQVHQDATSLPVYLQTPQYTYNGDSIPAVSASASRDKEGRVHLSLVNADPDHDVTVTCTLQGMKAANVTGQVLTASTMNAHNTFDHPDAVHPVAFHGASIEDGKLQVHLPSKSVVMLNLL